MCSSAYCGLVPFLLSVWGRGNPECWSNGFSFELCCNLEHGPLGKADCWDADFTFQSCCETKRDAPSHKTNVGRQSSVLRDKEAALQAEELGTLSQCQIEYGWGLSVQWGAPIGACADHSGVPLRHLGDGWDGQTGGNYRTCTADGSRRFFLIELDFESQASDKHKIHFGFCAPTLCSVEQVANELVPDYVIHVADARRLMMTLGSVKLWEWPHFLDAVYVSDSQDITLHQRITEVSFQMQVLLVSVASLVVLATLCDFSKTDCQSPSVNGAHDTQRTHLRTLHNLTVFSKHFVHAFSAKRAWRELQSPSGGATVDFLRGLATLLLLSLHLEVAQNESTDNQLEGGNLLRISFCFRCVIIMTVLTLHLALGSEKGETSVQRTFGNCSLKLARKFLRQLPLIMLSLWWDKTGIRYAFLNQPVNYIDRTLSTVGDDSVLHFTEYGNTCRASYWTCVFRFYTINWQVRDATERVLLCFGLLLLRAAGLPRMTHGMLYLWAIMYFVIKETGPDNRDEWHQLHCDGVYFLFKRLENPAFLGLFLAARNVAAALPQRLLTKRVGLCFAAASWYWSSWINQNDPAQWCLERNVKKCLGDVPFVVGLCILLRTGLPGEWEQSAEKRQSTFAQSVWTLTKLISRLSFCILVVEAPLQSFLLRGTAGRGIPLTRAIRADPMWERILLAPGLLLAHGVAALLLFIMVQRPVDVFLRPLLKVRLVEGMVHGLLPLYVAFLASQWNK